MSTVIYTPLQPGDARGSARVASILADFATGSATLDARNFAEEGMDGNPFIDHVVATRTGKLTETTRNGASLAAAAVFTQLVHNGTALRLSSPGDLPTSLSATEAVRVRARIWFETTLNSGQGLNGWFVGQLAWNDGSSTAKVPYTARYLYQGSATNARHAVFLTEGWIAGATNLSWVEVRYTLAAVGGGAGGIAFPSRSIVWAHKFTRIQGF